MGTLGTMGRLIYRFDVQQDGRLGDDGRFLGLLGSVGVQTLLLDAGRLLVVLVAAEQIDVVVVVSGGGFTVFHPFDRSSLGRSSLERIKFQRMDVLQVSQFPAWF